MGNPGKWPRGLDRGSMFEGNTAMATIGFSGLGNMGLLMAINLIEAGHQVLGFDLAEASRAALVAGRRDRGIRYRDRGSLRDGREARAGCAEGVRRRQPFVRAVAGRAVESGLPAGICRRHDAEGSSSGPAGGRRRRYGDAARRGSRCALCDFLRWGTWSNGFLGHYKDAPRKRLG